MCDFLLCVLPQLIYMFYLMYSYAIVFVWIKNCGNKSESEKNIYKRQFFYAQVEMAQVSETAWYSSNAFG